MSRKIVVLFVGFTLVALCTATPNALGQKPNLAPRRSRSNWRTAAPNGQRQPSSVRVSPAKDIQGLMRSLRASGLKVKSAGSISQPFFSVKGRALTVNGQQMQVFQYAKSEIADREAKRVDLGGAGTDTSRAMWVGPPHFYRSGRLIVLYVGSDAALIKALEKALGPQFAGQ